jgi:hypothetical protein
MVVQKYHYTLLTAHIGSQPLGPKYDLQNPVTDVQSDIILGQNCVDVTAYKYSVCTLTHLQNCFCI